MKLSKRLQCIASLVEDHSVLADVGSDHGKLIIYLAENHLITKGYAIENKSGPYHRLNKAICSSGLKNVYPVYADGISLLDESVDSVVIAGMGGLTIVDILKSHPERLKNVNTLIIDAHNAIEKVRKEISNLGYQIINETILKEDNQYYEVIKFIKVNHEIKYEDLDYLFGPILRKEKSSAFKEKYLAEIKDIEAVLKKANLPEERKENLIQRIKLIHQII